MTFEFHIGADDEADDAELESNEQARSEWLRHIHGQGKSTQRNYAIQLDLFLSRLDPNLIVTDITPKLWRSYLTSASATCRYLRRKPKNGGGGHRCTMSQDLNQCGLQCQEYCATRISTLDHHVRAVASFFSYLEFANYLPVNFIPNIYRDFKKSAPRGADEEAKYYCPDLEQVRQLILGTHAEPRRSMYIFMAKTGTRIEETATIPTDPNLYRRDEGLIEISGRRKRRGNSLLVLDAELSRHLDEFQEWRDRVAKPSTKTLFCTPRGDPLSSENLHKLNVRWWRKDAIRLGLQAPSALPGGRWHSHSMRHFFSDYISEQGIPDLWYYVLRGDKVKGTLGTYTEHKKPDRIRAQYAKYAPILAL